MRSLKDILKESILDDIDTQIEKGDKDIEDVTYKIPTLKDFYGNKYSSFVYWEGGDFIKQCKNIRLFSIPKNTKGITFGIDNFGQGIHKLYCKFNTSEGKFKFDYSSWNVSSVWVTKLDKNMLYCKKVILSLIEHLAKNPKALQELINYIGEYEIDRQASGSYNDGRTFKKRDLMELMKIKG